jgi:hypothetical protein
MERQEIVYQIEGAIEAIVNNEKYGLKDEFINQETCNKLIKAMCEYVIKNKMRKID